MVLCNMINLIKNFIEVPERFSCISRPKDWVANPVIQILSIEEILENKQLVSLKMSMSHETHTDWGTILD